MSALTRRSALMLQDIQARKGGAIMVILTAQARPMARAMAVHRDFVPLGDDVGGMLHGQGVSHGLGMGRMGRHGQAVAEDKLVVFTAFKAKFSATRHVLLTRARQKGASK